MNRSLALLNAMEEDLPKAELLRRALQEAVAEVGGLGGLAHLRGRAATPGLYLAASSGLPATFTRRWGEIADDATGAPAAAARLGRPVWCPAPEGPGTGIMSVPLHTPAGEPFGVLSVVTATPGEPMAAQREVLRAVAAWAAGRLLRARPPDVPPETPPAVPDVADETGFQEAHGAVGVGAWVWYMAPGMLELDEPSLALLGIDPETYDGHIETWINLVHPDDIAWVAAEVDKAISTFGPYDVEYRICRPDGTTRWVQVSGRAERDADGNPYRMLGAVWDTTESRMARDGVRSALRYMSDGFLSLDKAWRITFANVEAERLLGSSRKLAGRLLWDLLVIRRVPGLEAQCRKAAARSTPNGYEVSTRCRKACPSLSRTTTPS
jgi:PAS domain S-box-containing protein